MMNLLIHTVNFENIISSRKNPACFQENLKKRELVNLKLGKGYYTKKSSGKRLSVFLIYPLFFTSSQVHGLMKNDVFMRIFCVNLAGKRSSHINFLKFTNLDWKVNSI